ncbi:MAG: HEAT repeat domain-containing protein, partial [Planctomycetota bacterium]
LLLLALAALPAHAERIGEPYRGPFELLVANDPSTRPGVNRAPQFDGHVLWQFWWELNKDRYLARVTARRGANAGSALYWFGSVAKYPPRDLVPVSAAQRKARVLEALATRLRRDPHPAVRAEAAIALGRLGEIRNGQNAVTRELTQALDRETHAEVRASVILALGMGGDPAGCRVLMERLDRLGPERPYVHLAFGLARYLPAADLLVSRIPRRARGRRATDATVSAVHALGLMGPAAAAAIGPAGVERLAALVDRRGDDVLVMQAVRTLSLLDVERETVARLAEAKSSKNKRWAALLALAHYSRAEADAGAAARVLQGRRGFGSGDNQDKCFSVLALGELAAGLDPNSALRDRVCRFLRAEALASRNNYVRACAAIALGVAQDGTATRDIAALLTDTTAQDHVVAAACVGLGLLGATRHADTIQRKVMLPRKRDDDTRGYAALGLALMGATPCVNKLSAFARSPGITAHTRRQLPLALGVLATGKDVGQLTRFFERGWKRQDRHAASSAAFGFAWLRDRSAVHRLVRLTQSRDAAVRGMAVIALGYCGARDRVNPLARCYANTSHRDRYGGWRLLEWLGGIL